MERPGLGRRVARGIYLNENDENEKKPGLGRRIAQGIYLNEENSNNNSNNNSNTSVRAHNSNNESLFEHNSNEDSNESHENWTEKVSGKPRKKENGRVGFSNTRSVRRIDPFGQSRRNFFRHVTRTRKALGNVAINRDKTRKSYSVARLVATAHKQGNSYNSMRNFVQRAKAAADVKEGALRRLETRYKNYNKPPF